MDQFHESMVWCRHKDVISFSLLKKNTKNWDNPGMNTGVTFSYCNSPIRALRWNANPEQLYFEIKYERILGSGDFSWILLKIKISFLFDMWRTSSKTNSNGCLEISQRLFEKEKHDIYKFESQKVKSTKALCHCWSCSSTSTVPIIWGIVFFLKKTRYKVLWSFWRAISPSWPTPIGEAIFTSKFHPFHLPPRAWITKPYFTVWDGRQSRETELR